MAKITRKHQKIFAGDVPATNVLGQFGSLKAGTKIYDSSVDILQELPAWGEGWASAVINNYAPTLQDLNTIFYVVSRQLSYLYQNGIPAWDSTETYYVGGLVLNNGTIYMSLVNDNTNQSLTLGTKWLNLFSNKITTHASDSDYTALNADSYIRCTEVLSAARYVYLPAPASTNAGRIITVKMVGSTFVASLRVAVTGGSTIDGSAFIALAQYARKSFISNGTNWEQYA